jgi:hypothetical protein
MGFEYSDPTREGDPHSLPDIEVFYVSGNEQDFPYPAPDERIEPGWYWWSCSPGYLPDGEPSGPFDTEEAALVAARGD